LYLTNSLVAAVIEPALYSLQHSIYQIAYIFCCCLCGTKLPIPVRGKCSWFATKPILRWEVVNTSSNFQVGWQPLVCCPRLLIQYIRNYTPYWRPFLHPQPMDVPCSGNRFPLITDVSGFIFNIIIIIIICSNNVNSGKTATLVQHKLKIKQANIEDSVAESLFSKLPSSISNCLW
jgi:hypothetical protein